MVSSANSSRIKRMKSKHGQLACRDSDSLISHSQSRSSKSGIAPDHDRDTASPNQRHRDYTYIRKRRPDPALCSASANDIRGNSRRVRLGNNGDDNDSETRAISALGADTEKLIAEHLERLEHPHPSGSVVTRDYDPIVVPGAGSSDDAQAQAQSLMIQPYLSVQRFDSRHDAAGMFGLLFRGLDSLAVPIPTPILMAANTKTRDEVVIQTKAKAKAGTRKSPVPVPVPVESNVNESRKEEQTAAARGEEAKMEKLEETIRALNADRDRLRGELLEVCGRNDRLEAQLKVKREDNEAETDAEGEGL